MNIFSKIATAETVNDTKLGMPSTDIEHFHRRMTIMSNIRGGNGFRTPAKELDRRSDGTTRGDRKRALRDRANGKVSESRAPEYMHSTARRRDAVARAAA